MTAKSMRGVRLLGHGGLEQLDYREDLPVPSPGVGEVLIALGAAALNNTDINLRIGWYSKSGGDEDDAAWTGGAVTFPRIQGADACGRIVAVGDGVLASRIGERVLVNPWFGSTATGRGAYFGSDCDGAFAEFAVVPASHALKIESKLSDAELASFPCSYSAAENMLARATVSAGQTVLVTGASGGVGSALVQLAKRRGATVIALASASKAKAVESIGASQVFDRDADLVASLGRDSVDVVADVVGGAQFPALLDVLRPGGRYSVAGAIAGAQVPLDLRTVYLKDLTLVGCTRFEARLFRDLVGYIERGEIRPLVSATFALRDMAAAQTAFLAKSSVGKIVVQ